MLEESQSDRTPKKIIADALKELTEENSNKSTLSENQIMSLIDYLRNDVSQDLLVDFPIKHTVLN